MRTLAFTVVQNDMVALKSWANYYKKYFDDLAVLCFQTNSKYTKHIKKMGLKHEFVEEVLDPEKTFEVLKVKQREFLKDHDWVLFCNLDEFLFTKPNRFKDLKDLMKKWKDPYIHCVAYDVYCVGREKPLKYHKPLLSQRHYWKKNVNYNKIILSRVPLDWNEGTHQIREFTGEESKLFKSLGLYLVHFKHADPTPAGKRDFGPWPGTPHLDRISKKEEFFKGLTRIPTWAKQV